MPDRPLECSECRKPTKVLYTEIISEKVVRTTMCADCPQLQKKLYGKGKTTMVSSTKVETALACANCGTTLDALYMGHPIGCHTCYEVFSELLVDILFKESCVSKHLSTPSRTQPLHIGRASGEVTEISPTLQLIALNEALDETLIREDYEQAALLRDQIDALKEKNDKRE
ncbi:MAG: hypothetical protein S4CHLAM81_14700 [Chlamydiales bacterium]|nr:hypothetical protein [Chlamydiales bacterium]MCH9636239.1 hypothetical protein [Chlamydiales bacterium]MCH9703715.1 hypothetical protein [Chlamydiota bacterium]